MRSLYNPATTDKAGFEPIIGGDPSGLLNMSSCRYEWAVKIYDGMMARDWTPKTVNTEGEGKRYRQLELHQSRMYDLAFAQLSFDDAAQADAIQLLNRLITNKVVSACIHRISYEEVNHSNSYAVLLHDATGDANRVFDLYRTDPMLSRKNAWIAERYSRYSADSDAFMLAVMAQVVEGIIFLGGFVSIFSLGNTMTASAAMVAEIAKDEINSHLPFFANVVKTIRREASDTRDSEVAELIDEAVRIEIEWLNYITEGVLGFTPALNHDYVRSVADERLVALGLPKQYNAPRSHLNKLLDSYVKINNKKTNFFEGTVQAYSKQGLDFDDF